MEGPGNPALGVAGARTFGETTASGCGEWKFCTSRWPCRASSHVKEEGATMSKSKRPGKDDGLTVITTWPGDGEETPSEKADGAPPEGGESKSPEPDAEKEQAEEEFGRRGQWTPPSGPEGWSPDHKEVDDGVEDQLALLGPVIRQTWLITASGALGSFGLVVWAFGQENALPFQALMALDGILLLVLGLGLYSHRLGLGYALLGWTLFATLLALLMGGPLTGQAQQAGWMLWRASLLLAFIRGVTAVARWNKLRPEGSGTIPWRLDQALYALASPFFIVVLVVTVISVAVSFTMNGADMIAKARERQLRAGLSEIWERYQEMADLAKEAAVDAGRRGTEFDCQSLTLERQATCPDLACRSVNMVFLTYCLATSNVAPGYCRAVPRLADKYSSSAWRQTRCDSWMGEAVATALAAPEPEPETEGPSDEDGVSRVNRGYLAEGDAANDCASLMSRIQYHCHGAAREQE
jgi:hypothetical protein